MAETVAQIGEFGLIRRLNDVVSREGARAPGVSAGIGDDTAILRPREGMELLVTCDSMVEGRHYLPEVTTPRAVGRRAMTMNVSDVGAMGGVPLYALVSLGLRGDTAVADVEELYRGFLQELNPFGAAIVGGNLTGVEHAEFIDVTLIGEVEPGRALRRSTARPGDAILVTGFPGRAAAGLAAHRAGTGQEPALLAAYSEPSHRAREGRAVAQSGAATAMIDTSDGLLGDLGHICEDSGAGAELSLAALPLADDLRRLAAALGRDPLGWVLGDSDDYELVVTCPPDRVEDLRAAITAVGGLPVAEIGRVVAGPPRIDLLSADGSRRAAAPRGWDHFRREEP